MTMAMTVGWSCLNDNGHQGLLEPGELSSLVDFSTSARSEVQRRDLSEGSPMGGSLPYNLTLGIGGACGLGWGRSNKH